MLSASEFLYITSFSGIILAMPGPTNTLLFSSGVTRGLRQSATLIWAELIGYLLAISLWGVLLLQLVRDHQWILIGLNLIASAYIAWLAIKTWRFNGNLHTQSSVTWGNVFFATLFNPKAFLFASQVMPTGTFTNLPIYGSALASFTLVLLPISACWCLFGHLVSTQKPGMSFLSPRKFLRLSAIALATFSASIFYSAVSRI